jgi:hypothetical protein
MRGDFVLLLASAGHLTDIPETFRHFIELTLQFADFNVLSRNDGIEAFDNLILESQLAFHLFDPS